MTHQEPQAKPRYGFNEWYADLRAQQTQRQIEDIKRGLFRREDKIHLLEGLLYSRIQDGEPVEELIWALALLQENKIQDDRLYNSPIAQINGVIAFLVAVGLAATVFSFISLPFCGGSHSKFCEGGRVIPGAIADIFREPANIKGK